MSRKASSRSSHSASSASSKPAVKVKPKAGLAAVEKPKPFPVAGKPAAVPSKPAPVAHAEPPASRSNGSPPPKPKAAAENEAETQLISRAERDITAAIESLNTQMNAALSALAGLACTHTERGKAVVRTAPIDRATATFQRLVAEVVDDQFTEMLPPLIGLRNEMKQWSANGDDGSPEADFHRRGLETLDNVLAMAGATAYEPRPGQAFDPLIHLAVGEIHRGDLPEGAVAECLQPGFRSGRGKVLAPARVRINRR